MLKTFFGAQRIVFVLDAQHTSITNLAKVSDIFAPMDLPVTRDRVPPPTVGQNSHVLPAWVIDQTVLGVGMKNSLTVPFNGYHDVEVLMDQVRWIIVQAEMIIGQ